MLGVCSPSSPMDMCSSCPMSICDLDAALVQHSGSNGSVHLLFGGGAQWRFALAFNVNALSGVAGRARSRTLRAV